MTFLWGFEFSAGCGARLGGTDCQALFASEELQADRDVVLAAVGVQQNGRALKYRAVQADREVVMAAACTAERRGARRMLRRSCRRICTI